MLRMMEFYFGSRTSCETDCSKLQRRFWHLVWRCCFKVTGYIQEAGCKYAWSWSTERRICFNLISVSLDFRALGAHNWSNYKDTLMKQRLEPKVRSWILVSKKCRERENLYLLLHLVMNLWFRPVSPLSLLSFTSTGWFACGQAHNERLWELQGFIGILVLCACVCVRPFYFSNYFKGCSSPATTARIIAIFRLGVEVCLYDFLVTYAVHMWAGAFIYYFCIIEVVIWLWHCAQSHFSVSSLMFSSLAEA